MIILISSNEKSFRKDHIDKLISLAPQSEIIFFNDTYGNILDLEQYIFPSLFSISMPIIHLKFTLDENAPLITNIFIKKLISSPTIFLFEEMSTSTTISNLFKKAGAIAHIDSKLSVTKKDNNMFGVVSDILTKKDKKSRWIAYQKAISEYDVEGIIGILYWKIKDLISKNKGEQQQALKILYTKMLEAHKTAWQKNIPLELTVEKVILNN